MDENRLRDMEPSLALQQMASSGWTEPRIAILAGEVMALRDRLAALESRTETPLRAGQLTTASPTTDSPSDVPVQDSTDPPILRLSLWGQPGTRSGLAGLTWRYADRWDAFKPSEKIAALDAAIAMLTSQKKASERHAVISPSGAAESPSSSSEAPCGRCGHERSLHTWPRLKNEGACNEDGCSCTGYTTEAQGVGPESRFVAAQETPASVSGGTVDKTRDTASTFPVSTPPEEAVEGSKWHRIRCPEGGFWVDASHTIPRTGDEFISAHCATCNQVVRVNYKRPANADSGKEGWNWRLKDWRVLRRVDGFGWNIVEGDGLQIGPFEHDKTEQLVRDHNAALESRAAAQEPAQCSHDWIRRADALDEYFCWNAACNALRVKGVVYLPVLSPTPEREK